MPSRSIISANEVCGSRPDTKTLSHTLCATTLVATRTARSGRVWTAAAIRPAMINVTAGQISFRAITVLSRVAALECVQPRRIVDEDFLADGCVGSPHRQ